MSYYWEDIDLGFTETFGPIAVDREEVLAFARRYDPQPFHLDEQAAAQTHFGRLAASGWHTCAMMMGAMVEHWQATPGWQESSLGAIGIDELRWIKPVRPGDRLRARVCVIEARRSQSKPDRGIVRERQEVINQEGDTVMSVTSMGMYKCRSSSSEGDQG